jgi:hypothetical protein
VSPGFMILTAFEMVLKGDARLPSLASLPFVATK